MIYLIVGESQFRVDAAIATAVGQADDIVRYDGAALTRETLVGALFSVSLFASRRAVIIDELSKQKSLWEALPEICEDASSVEVILYEPRPDKRLKTYKWLVKQAKIIDCSHILASDSRVVEKWLVEYAAGQGVALTQGQVRDMVQRALRSDAHSSKPIIDQQLLATAISQLRNTDTVTDEMIDTVIAPSVYENVFNLLGTALDGSADEVSRQVAAMRHSEEGYMVLGLLASQLSQLAALQLAGPGRSLDEVAKATGAHPFALRSMQRYSSRLSTEKLAQHISDLKDADARIKTSSVDPWTAIDVALAKISLASRQ